MPVTGKKQAKEYNIRRPKVERSQGASRKSERDRKRRHGYGGTIHS